ncbi:hypothetical protein EOD39_11558 [Acipenser ruthenus]|uniref:E3 SUMO-protein ligase KIAA1586 n=1 Tax=Acipenser ruthenus TaxID=7906 RepID=A0A662YS20_ACIRT|nr:hypothetical protein EOD39_11558 [Acipenser ruthenus]
MIDTCKVPASVDDEDHVKTGTELKTNELGQCEPSSREGTTSDDIATLIHVSDSCSGYFPSYWKKEQWLEKIKEHEWLVVGKGDIGCRACKSAGTLGPLKSQGLKLSREWIECRVSCFSDTDEKKRQSVRKKIFDHKTNIAHKRSLEICEAAKKEQIEIATARQESAYQENTCRVFRTEYTLAKLNRPFTDLPVLLNLQSENGLDVGRVLQSDHSCADITDHIAKSMRRKLVESVISEDLKIGFMIDKSTTVSKKASLVICMKVVFPKSDEASSMFFVLVQLADTTASTILDTFRQALYDNGFTREFLSRNFVSFATDGACNMLGRKSGVATLLQEMFPDIIVWHCSNHRLELAVSDVVEELSLELQKRSTTLMRAHKLIEEKCLVFESVSKRPGEHFLISQQAVRSGEFKGVALQKGRMTAIDHTRFYNCLSIKMEQQMLTTRSSHRAFGQSKQDEDKTKYQDLLKHMEVFDKSKWPRDPDICFGDESIRHLCAFFRISQAQGAVSGFREYVSDMSDEDDKVPERLKQLLDVLKTLIISTAECERSFSAMNDILTNIRNSLSLENTSKLIF